jgi:hypothetical protein
VGRLSIVNAAAEKENRLGVDLAEISPTLMLHFFDEINLANKDIFTESIGGMAAELSQLRTQVGLFINHPARLKNPNWAL